MWNVSSKVLVGAGTALALSYLAYKMLKSSFASPAAKNTTKIMRLLDKISLLQSPSVHIRNPQKVEEMLCKIVRDGKSKFMLIADFDFTLSRFHDNGKKCQTCHGALNASSLIPKIVQDESEVLYNFYHPIELDHHISAKEKGHFMAEWWKKSAELIVTCKLHKDDIKRIIKDSDIKLRDRCDLLLKTLYEHNVPVFIISAGLGDLMAEVIHQQSTMYGNMKIVANFMDFDSNGSLVAFKDETIHCCNKNQAPLYQAQCFEHVTDHQNAILMGDIVEDSSMADALTNLETVLKIGFLNNNFKEFLPKYMEIYDIVLVDDQSFDVLNSMLQIIL